MIRSEQGWSVGCGKGRESQRILLFPAGTNSERFYFSIQMQEEHEKAIVVTALYHFARLDDCKELRERLQAQMEHNNVKGTLLLASEGVNGTIAGSRQGVRNVVEFLQSHPKLGNLEFKESFCEEQPFFRTKVRLKKEIVTMGVQDVDPTTQVGQYLSPAEWNELLRDPEVVVVDTRNDYEVEIGSFRGAINPQTRSFREFPRFVEEHLSDHKDKKIAMFCTGGIRCEKSTSLLLHQGFQQVYHLKGGVLKYLEETKREDSLWEGECFVFDNRVAVNHDLQPGEFSMCRGCRAPLKPSDMESEHFRLGVHCPKCYGTLTTSQYERFASRQRQVELAQLRNEQHIGVQPKVT